LARKTTQGATSIVKFGWHISIIKAMFIKNAPSYRKWNSSINTEGNVGDRSSFENGLDSIMLRLQTLMFIRCLKTF
jgi:hypothetical protein